MIAFKGHSFDFFCVFLLKRGRCYNIIITDYTTEAVTQNDVNAFCKRTCAATPISQFIMDCSIKGLFSICLKTLL